MASISSAWTFVWACAKRSHSSSTIDYKRLSKLIWICAGYAYSIDDSFFPSPFLAPFELSPANPQLSRQSFPSFFFSPLDSLCLCLTDSHHIFLSLSFDTVCVHFPFGVFLADTKTHSNHSAIPPYQLRYHIDVYIHTRSNALHTFLPSSWAAVESDFKLGRVEKKNPGMNNPGLEKKKAKS
jgi:hypothetical protein